MGIVELLAARQEERSLVRFIPPAVLTEAVRKAKAEEAAGEDHHSLGGDDASSEVM